MINAMQEYLEEVKGKTVRYAYIRSFDTGKVHSLNVDYTLEELEVFLQGLDFEYDNGHGTQELDGIIWYDDDTWSSRGEYDGSEWWAYHEVPDVPEFLVKQAVA